MIHGGGEGEDLGFVTCRRFSIGSLLDALTGLPPGRYRIPGDSSKAISVDKETAYDHTRI